MERPRGSPERRRPAGEGQAPVSRRRAGGAGGGGGRREHVPDLLIPSILVLIFCCLIGGIIALIYSIQANSAKQAGNYRQAAQAAKTAKTWIIVSVVVGLLFGIIYFVMMMGASTTSSYSY